jgi:hypothetical protein
MVDKQGSAIISEYSAVGCARRTIFDKHKLDGARGAPYFDGKNQAGEKLI